MLGQRQRRWANISPALVQCLVFAGTALSQAVAHSGEGHQQRRDIDHVLVQCWPIVSDAGPPLKQHQANVTCLLGGGHGANRSVTIQLDEGGDIVCIHLRLTLPLPNNLL